MFDNDAANVPDLLVVLDTLEAGSFKLVRFSIRLIKRRLRRECDELLMSIVA